MEMIAQLLEEQGPVVLAVPLGLALLLLAMAFMSGRESKSHKRLVARVRGDKRQLAALEKAEVSVRRKQAKSRLPGVESFFAKVLPRRDELQIRLERTGLTMTLSTYVTICAVITVIAGFALYMTGMLPPMVCGLFGVAAGVGLPHALVALLIKRRQARFLANFPEAIDLMTRGLKSGLPIVESIKTAAEEVPDPVGSELQRVTDEVRLGAKLDESLAMASDRLALQEFKFFTISLAIQAETGGNLTETLMNLADVLRKRRQLKLKIRALSSEAKASAYIIGSLPFVMAFVIYMINAGYISALVIDPRGHVLIGLGLTSFAVGAMVMWKMVRFDY